MKEERRKKGRKCHAAKNNWRLFGICVWTTAGWQANDLFVAFCSMYIVVNCSGGINHHPTDCINLCPAAGWPFFQ